MKSILFSVFLTLLSFALVGQVKVINSGFVKIGATANSPLAPLHVEGASPSFGTQLFRVEDANGFFNVSEGTNAPGKFIPTFRFQSGGFGGVGGIVIGSVPDALDIQGAANTGALIFDARAESNVALTGSRLFTFRTPTSSVLSILANGNVGIGNNITATEKLHVDGNILATGSVTPSDRRLKSGIKSFNYGLKQVLKLETIKYKYNGKAGITDTQEKTGLIAQELKEIAPDLVGEYTYSHYPESAINNGEIELDESQIVKEDFLYIKEGEIKYMLINAIQDQQQLIDNQNDRITQLEEAIQKLASISDLGENVSDVTLNTVYEAELFQNVPNPFDASTQIKYNIPNDSESSEMVFFDMNGRLLKTVRIDHLGEGIINLNALDLKAGTYTYSLKVNGRLQGTKKMILTK